ncbi:hypothetical protein H9Q09_11920 [Aurantimonas sp. DM33-3]|uniref:phage tail tube protein n=1 Tax=Aurantimonas TaxID=182269 RepID=UPI001652652B|nr:MULTISPECIES: hypothetical protein [Aurantimonas]MBC6716915.1 hypothetical protein [Aurantimonas sp. DM33-3]MCC4298440.1 hypothetical protein [Aurantimonas coralicida]
MAGSPIVRPLDNSFRFQTKGQWLIKLPGSKTWKKAGDYNEFKFSYNIEENEIYSNEYPEQTLAFVDVTKAEVSLGFTTRMMTDFLRRVAFMSKPGLTFDQAAADAVIDTTFAAAGDVIEVAHRNLTNVALTVKDELDAEIDLVEGTHYAVSAADGLIDVFALPADAAVNENGEAEVTTTYDAEAIVGQVAYGVLSATDIRASVKFLQNTKLGVQHEVEFWDVQIRADGDVVLGSDGTEMGEMGYTGRVFADPTRGAGFEMARVLERARAA